MKITHWIALILAGLAFSVPAIAEHGRLGSMGIEFIPDDDPIGKTSQHRLISIYAARPKYSELEKTLSHRSGANAQATEFGLFVRNGNEALGHHLEMNHLLSDIAENEGKSFGLYLIRRFR